MYYNDKPTYVNISELLFNASFMSANGHVSSANNKMIMSSSCLNTIITIAASRNTVKRHTYGTTHTNQTNSNWTQRMNNKTNRETLKSSQHMEPEGQHETYVFNNMELM